MRWSGGACEDIQVQMPAKIADRLRYPTERVQQIRDLAANCRDHEIADRLNQAGCLSTHGNPFTAKTIAWIRHKHRIPAPDPRRPGELTVPQVADRFSVSHHVVYYWIERSLLPARQERPNQPYWITLSPAQVVNLTRWVEESNRIVKHQVTDHNIPNTP
jgi:hypothetical protein